MTTKTCALPKFKLPATVDEKIIAYFGRSCPRKIQMKMNGRKCATYNNPDNRNAVELTMHVVSALTLSDDRWLVAVFAPNSNSHVSDLLVVEYHGKYVVGIWDAKEYHEVTVPDSDVRSMYLAKFTVTNFEDCGAIECCWYTLTPATRPTTAFNVPDPR